LLLLAEWPGASQATPPHLTNKEQRQSNQKGYSHGF
jgi:hypothetical protein